MKQYMPMIAVSILALASVAAVSVFDFSSTPLAIAGVEKHSASDITLFGHLELVATDAAGNIKAYVQTDNAIVQQGTGCIISSLFGDGGTGNGCAGSSGFFDSVILGIGSPADCCGVAENVGTLSNATQAGLDLIVEDTDVFTDNSGTTFTNATVSVQFTNTGGSQELISEAVLFNGTGGSQPTAGFALAYQNFTAIPLDTSDSLTIDWTVTVTEG